MEPRGDELITWRVSRMGHCRQSSILLADLRIKTKWIPFFFLTDEALVSHIKLLKATELLSEIV